MDRPIPWHPSHPSPARINLDGSIDLRPEQDPVVALMQQWDATRRPVPAQPVHIGAEE